MYATKTKKIAWLVLDRSGSMESVRDVTISAYNEYLQTLKTQATECELHIGLTLFADQPVVGLRVPVGQMVPLTQSSYRPDGCTALYDAIGASIQRLEQEAAVLGGPDSVPIILCIQTDGNENSSREFTQQRIFQMIAERKARGNWTFVFLGADQDAYAASASMGLSGANTISYGSADTGKTVRGLGKTTANYLNSSKRSTEDFKSFAESEKPPSK